MWLNQSLAKRQVWFLPRTRACFNLTENKGKFIPFSITDKNYKNWTNGKSDLIAPEILDRWIEE